MTGLFPTRPTPPGPVPAGPAATATERDDDTTTGQPATAAEPPAEVLPDALNFCHCCRRYKPKAGWAKWRCGDCAAKAAKVPKCWTTRPAPKEKAGVAAPASLTTKGNEMNHESLNSLASTTTQDGGKVKMQGVL